MARMKPYFKLGNLMLTCEVVTKQEIQDKLGAEIDMRKVSMYIWEIKKYLGGIVKSHKNGRTVVGYQLIKPEMIKTSIEMEYKRIEEINSRIKSKKIKKLEELNAQEVVDKIDEIVLESENV